MVIPLLAWIGFVSLVTAVLFWRDKRRASAGTRRIPERTLWTWAWLGGAAGGWFAMRRWRHKTRHRAFAWGLPLLTAAQVTFVVWLSLR